MAQYYYVIDTGITSTRNGVSVAVGQTTYDLLLQEKYNHGVVPVSAEVGLWHTEDGINHLPDYSVVGITTNRAVEVNNSLQVVDNLSVTGFTTSSSYIVGGVQAVSNASPTQIIDASTTQMHHHSTTFNELISQTLAFKVSNLTSGRYVNIYVKNAGTDQVTVSLQASITSTGHSTVRFANKGSTDTDSFTLVVPSGGGPTGAASIWIANMDGNFVATLS